MHKAAVRKILDAGLFVSVECEGEIDYQGDDYDKAIAALEACDEIDLRVLDQDGDFVAWALVCSGLDDDETIVDHTISFERFL